MEWTDLLYGSLITVLAIGVVFVLGFFIGSMCGYARGRSDVAEYYSSYREEDAEIISRLRGRIIWLEASIKETLELVEKSHISALAASTALTSASLKLQETKEDVLSPGFCGCPTEKVES